MRVAVMGSGGVGGYFGARLAQRATTSRSSPAADISRRCASAVCGAQRTGDVHLSPPSATDDPSALAASTWCCSR